MNVCVSVPSRTHTFVSQLRSFHSPGVIYYYEKTVAKRAYFGQDKEPSTEICSFMNSQLQYRDYIITEADIRARSRQGEVYIKRCKRKTMVRASSFRRVMSHVVRKKSICIVLSLGAICRLFCILLWANHVSWSEQLIRCRFLNLLHSRMYVCLNVWTLACTG